MRRSKYNGGKKLDDERSDFINKHKKHERLETMRKCSKNVNTTTLISLSSIARRAEEDHLSPFQRKQCFTLIELLVVIAIIAILAAMLLPVLRSAVEKGHQVTCLNKLKQIGYGVQGYTDDNKEYKPCVCWNNNGSSPVGYHYRQIGGTATKNIAPHYTPSSENSTFWQCPAVTAVTQATTNYGMSAHHGLTQHLKYDLVCRTGDDDGSKLSRIVSLSKTWIYTCGLRWGISCYKPPATNISNSIPSGWNMAPKSSKESRVFAAHKKVIPMLFCDGHGELVLRQYYDSTFLEATDFWGNKK